LDLSLFLCLSHTPIQPIIHTDYHIQRHWNTFTLLFRRTHLTQKESNETNPNTYTQHDSFIQRSTLPHTHTHRHTDTEPHTHTHTHTQLHTHTHTHTHTQLHTNTHTHRHTHTQL